MLAVMSLPYSGAPERYFVTDAAVE